MRIPLPFGIPLEIVGHRPGHPVNSDDARNSDAPAARSYLPFKLRRTGRPTWANLQPSRAAASAAALAGIVVDSPTDVPDNAPSESLNIAESPHFAHVAEQLGENTTGTTGTTSTATSAAIATHHTGEATAEQIFAENLAVLAAWVNGEPHSDRVERVEVAEHYWECWNNPHEGQLTISEKNLITSLPPMPPTVTEFTVWMCPNITTLPALAGHPELRELNLIACDNLTQLPDASQCEKLKTYVVQDCVGVVDPPGLTGCRQLEVLNFSGCTNLRSMPATTDCLHLKDLDINDCEHLTGAVDLSAHPQLEELSMSGCSHVNALDLTGCTQINWIGLERCTGLTTLPPVGHLQQLDYLNMTNTPLTSLPEDFLSLPPDCEIQLDASRLSDAVRNRLFHVMNDPDYVGPHIDYSMGQASSSIPAKPIEDEVAAWRAEAPPHLQQVLTQFNWSVVPKTDNVNAFSQFLGRVRETNDYQHASPALKAATQHRVATLLTQMQTDVTLRENCFNLATDAIDTCGDRVALRFLDMENCAVLSEAKAALSAGGYDSNPQALIDVCKGQHRLEIIAQEAKDKAATMNYVDLIEVHLGYLTKLTAPYQLPVQIKTMLYPACSHVTADDITAASKKCSNDGLSPAECANNDQAYQCALAASELMRGQLERWDAPQMRAANATKDRLVAHAADTLYAQLDALNPTDANFNEQNRQLQTAFNVLEADSKVQTTHPVLHAFLQAHQLDSSLGNAPMHAGTEV